MALPAPSRLPLELLKGGSGSDAYAALPDEALAARLKRRDQAAFGELFRRYKLTVYRVVRRHADGEADALDLTQRVFLRAFEAHVSWLSRFRGPNVPLKAYLLRIAVNAGKNHRRDVARRPLAPLQTAEGLASREDPETGLDARAATDRLWLAADALPKRQREVLRLRIDGELSFREVGEALGISEQNAKSNYHHAVQRLRALLSGEDS